MCICVIVTHTHKISGIASLFQLAGNYQHIILRNFQSLYIILERPLQLSYTIILTDHVYYTHCLCLCSIAATQKAAQAKITVEDQIKAIQEAQGLL